MLPSIASQFFDILIFFMDVWIRTRFDLPLKHGVELFAEIDFVRCSFLARFRVDWGSVMVGLDRKWKR